jgi:transcriptional regulator with XRE-family HTH domain
MSENSQLVEKLSRSENLRAAYIRSKVSTNIASQIRALRRRESLTQGEFAQLLGMKQSRISAMERPGTRLNVETLVRLAAALKIALTVHFGTYSDTVRWQNRFDQDKFSVVKLENDVAFLSDSELEQPETSLINPSEFSQRTIADAPDTKKLRKLARVYELPHRNDRRGLDYDSNIQLYKEAANGKR